jgi:hypothetical protein
MEEEEVEEEEEEAEEDGEQPQLDQELFMVSDSKELHKHHPIVTTDSQQLMLSTVMDVNSLIPTKVLVCGGKLTLGVSSTFNLSRSETEEIAVVADWQVLKFSLETLSVDKFKMEPKMENGIR